jgi:hypothetical protein
MAFDKNGNIFVTDFNNHRIQKFILDINSCGMSVSNATEWIENGCIVYCHSE